MDFLSEFAIELFSKYIVVVVLGSCLAIGFIIKHSFDFIPNKYIPLIVGTLGVVLNTWSNSWAFTPVILLEGLASGLASTGAFEAVKTIRGDRK